MDKFEFSRFEFGVPNAQEKEVYTYCSVTHAEIYHGDNYLETLSGDALLDDKEILMEHFQVVRKVAGEEVTD
ncbi:hypothetical protein [Paenibacillus xylaniclasticus]|uniref:hypothetical protein n=1 Tax=Paenibacillus xylaniclasticus TaxID=588083 RepID=UPI000FDC8410|nr:MULTISPECIES: hypothetical protein [Paenibacillus]GFN32389.1 hypothetical protein PCURB6_26490 [Paenibacillus curdlanolyticus]